jgi:cytochrome c biogenesis protein CcdA
MFERGYRRLHLYAVCTTVGVFSGYITFAVLLSAIFTEVQILKQAYFLIPCSLWIIFMLAHMLLAFTIKCLSCDKYLVLITSNDNAPINKGWVLWFLREIPPIAKCEKCGEVYAGSPNKPLKQDK